MKKLIIFRLSAIFSSNPESSVMRFVYILFYLLNILAAQLLSAQSNSRYVNPFIGTDKSDVITKWGSEGGTYPGAVAPWGAVQLTPETRMHEPRGYYYSDSLIYFFSCFHHMSGFPNGSAGRFYVMPVADTATFSIGKYASRFKHSNEIARPGYYSVYLQNNNTRVEAAASDRCGVFRFTYPAGIQPFLFVSKDRGNIAMRFNTTIAEEKTVDNGKILLFKYAPGAPTIIEMQLSSSSVSKESAERNIEKETGTDSFDKVYQKTAAKWEQALAVVSVDDPSEKHKTIFYTALYHSLLVPWVVSDAEGYYRGYDGKIYQSKDHKQYGGFSPWDSFRTLHPLLSLLFPGRQKDMILSLLDIYQQTGHLPTESMTGNHAVNIIVDSWRKGITADSALTYNAIKSNISTGPFLQKDMDIYRKKNYVPFSYPESVTRTVEYAYNDWGLAQFAGKVMKDEVVYTQFQRNSYNYRNLFNADQLFLLPRRDNDFKTEPGTTGYKEGDKWIYSFFVPQHPDDLVNLMGGPAAFSERLDSALRNNVILFDNETVFHLPYFFNKANRPSLTQKWVSAIMAERYNNTPGGLPGNDDLGATSSWFVLSAMGLYPFAPGEPVYTLSTPLFKSLTLHLANGKTLTIQKHGAAATGRYVSSVAFDQTALTSLDIAHDRLMNGGTMDFTVSPTPQDKHFKKANDTGLNPIFTITGSRLSKNKVYPGENIRLYYSIRNEGAPATNIITLYANGKAYLKKNCFVNTSQTVSDTIDFQLYHPGKTAIALNNEKPQIINVQHKDIPLSNSIAIRELHVLPLLHPGEMQKVSFFAKNISGDTRSFNIPVTFDSMVLHRIPVTLQPGEEKVYTAEIPVKGNGFKTIKVEKAEASFRICQKPAEALVLDLSMRNDNGGIIKDLSGFGNNGKVIGKYQSEDSLVGINEDCFVALSPAPSLDKMGEKITMMGWIYTTGGDNETVDLISKGDHHVIQVSRNRSVKFFAGGWGRGECIAALPQDWKNNWHHIAGVCDGNTLKVYIDGVLQTTTPLTSKTGLSVIGEWNIGRNEEFPSERMFTGYMKGVKIFADALSEEEIRNAMH
jgi:putative alpha-1,2-mannosidase